MVKTSVAALFFPAFLLCEFCFFRHFIERPSIEFSFHFVLFQLAKPRGKGGTHGTGHMFTCKASYSLLGKKVAEFSNDCKCSDVCLFQDYSQIIFFFFNGVQIDKIVIFCSFKALGNPVSREPEYHVSHSQSQKQKMENAISPFQWSLSILSFVSLMCSGGVE